MRRGLRTALTGLVVLALAAVVTVASATGASTTTEPIMIVPIQVSLTNTAGSARRQGRRPWALSSSSGSATRAPATRTFTIGGFKATVKPHGIGTILISFDTRGKFPYESRAATSVHRGFLRVV